MDKEKIIFVGLGKLGLSLAYILSTKFNVVFKNEREGRNPKTKEKFIITSRNTIKFKVSETLKKKIN